MRTISDLKEQAVTDTPIPIFDCVLSNGQTEQWNKRQVTVGGSTYQYANNI